MFARPFKLRPAPLLFAALLTLCGTWSMAQWDHGPGGPSQPVQSTRRLEIGGAVLQVDIAPGSFDLPIDTILNHVRAAATAVSTYYGRFPVSRARILIIPVPGKAGVLQGTTWGDMRGFPGFTRVRIGEHSTTADLAEDWMMTHELVHMAFPSLPDDDHWMEEGQATYIEPVARVQTGELKPEQIWRDMLHDMGKGEPAEGDQGLERTQTWGRTYWGGAMFCLVADVNIRKETRNARGLEDALRAVVAAGGTIDHEWPLPRALEIGDHATGTHVLTKLYAEWKDTPVQVDLPKLWADLGIRSVPGGVEFVKDAPLASIREAITRRSPNP